MDTADSKRSSAPYALVLIPVLLFVVVQLSLIQYGYHRDELYNIVMSTRLDWGYVDCPPLAPFLLFLVRSLFGSSLLALHVLPALAGAAVIFITFLMVKELGGGAPAAALAVAAAATAPQFAGDFSIYTYDYLDTLWWVLALFFLLRHFTRSKGQYLILFGLAAGLALQSKLTFAFLGAGFVLSLLLTRHRKLFGDRRLYLAAAVALLIFLPYLIWQSGHGWPTLDFFAHYASGKTYPVTPLEFLLNQVLIMGPLAFPLWAAGLVFFWTREGGRLRLFSWMYAVLLVLFIFLKSKSYLLAPFYPLLFAGGAVAVGGLCERRRRAWLCASLAVTIGLSGLLFWPAARPVLPVKTFVKLYRFMGTGIKQERHVLAGLPQHFADRHGWPELAKKCFQVYSGLPKEDQERAVFFMSNYGEAGAVNVLGRRYGLPEALSGHNQYFLWGPRGHSGEVVIVMNVGSREEMLQSFESVVEAARTDMPLAMPYEYDVPIYVCRRPKRALNSLWSEVKHFD